MHQSISSITTFCFNSSSRVTSLVFYMIVSWVVSSTRLILAPNVASASAYLFSCRLTCSTVKFSTVDKSFLIQVWYRANACSFTAKSQLIYWITKFESPMSLNFLAPNFFTVSNPIIVASYFASLLVQKKSFWKIIRNCFQ